MQHRSLICSMEVCLLRGNPTDALQYVMRLEIEEEERGCDLHHLVADGRER